ncbi:hypothetical protein AC579_3303 [Pseudocercospora musae]|uniref:Uncharacterized protein n=1 Tax=Pseudocercospora musae TaxID=113226 RepID=A0A139I9U7_9PEZI|nr:hypothetical protein AC579_3303 [Pseudocercospora musae]
MANFGALPLELVSSIAQVLSREHRPSLVKFALASKRCSSATSEFIFTNIRISLDDNGGEKWSVTRVSQVLQQRQCLGQVRRLEIHALQPRKLSAAELDKFFRPIADLVETLVGLEVIIWNANYPEIPTCIIDILRAREPRLRLNIRKWNWTPCQLPSAGIFPLQMAELTSPHLAGMSVIHCWVNQRNVLDERMDAFMRMLTQLPRLKRLFLYRQSKPLSYDAELSKPELEVSRQYAAKHQIEAQKSVTLEHLRLEGGQMRDDDLEILHGSRIKFDARKVEILRIMTSRILERMSGLVKFPSLEDLTILLDENAAGEPGTDWEYAFAAGYFFQSLPTLKKLDLRGRFSYDTLYNSLAHHGPHLTSLTLWSKMPRSRRDRVRALKPSQMEDLVGRCPQLQHLVCTIQRDYRPAFEEVRTYRALATLKKLHFACLTLRPLRSDIGSDGTVGFDDVFDDFHSQRIEVNRATSIEYGYIRDAFMNTAVDAALVDSIWSAITSSRKDHPLEKLEVRSQRNDTPLGTVASPIAERIFAHFCSDWVARRSVRDDSDELVIEKTWQEEERQSKTDAKIEYSSEMEVFRKIWPKKSLQSDWRNDWGSFPLQYDRKHLDRRPVFPTSSSTVVYREDAGQRLMGRRRVQEP